MREIPLHFGSILAATVARIAIGAMWYSPVLFVKRWQKLAGVSDQEMKQNFPKAIIIDVIGSFLMAFVLVHAIRYAEANDAVLGLAVGFLNWLGFVAVATIATVTYERRPFGLWAISNGYQLVSMLAMGAILGVWG